MRTTFDSLSVLFFPPPHPTCNDANLSLTKGERTDDVTCLQSESETENDEETTFFLYKNHDFWPAWFVLKFLAILRLKSS